MTQSDDDWMGEALAEADLAEAHADVPIGCVIVGATGQLLARGHNRRELDDDPTAHAEILALRDASKVVGHWRLDGATVYATLEPCPMCAGALVNARIDRLVYGARDPKAGACGSLFRIPTDVRLNHRVEIIEGVMAKECGKLLTDFFRTKRQLTRERRAKAG